MKPYYLKIMLAALVLFSGTARSEQSSIPELERKLQLRDETIIELLERVDALEQRTGIQRPESNRSEDPQQGATTLSQKEPAQAPGAVVVEEGDAERALERSLTVEGALLLPAGVLEIEPGFVYARREESAPGFVTVGNQVFPSETELNANLFTANLVLRLGLPWQSQLEIGQAYRRNKLESVTKIDFIPTASTKQTNNERGDLRVGFAKTLLREGLSRPDLVGRITWDTDTGDADSFDELQMSLTAIKRQDPVTFIGGMAYQHALKDGVVEPGSVTSMNFGSLVALSPETSMRFLFSASYQRETRLSGRKVNDSDRTVASFVTGGSTLIARGLLLNLSLGIGLTDDADNFSLVLSLPMRF